MPGYPQSGLWGKPEAVTIPDPGAGVQVTFAVPSNESWWLYSVTATFTTSAVVAGRLLTLTVDSAGVLTNASPKSTVGHPAGLAIRYFWQRELPSGAAFVDGRWFTQMPLLLLTPGLNVTLVVENLDPGDAFTNTRAMIHRSYL